MAEAALGQVGTGPLARAGGCWRWGAHVGLHEVRDLLWGRAGRGGESLDGALLQSAGDTGRKGLLCGHSWEPGCPEGRAELRSHLHRHQDHVAEGFMVEESRSVGLLHPEKGQLSHLIHGPWQRGPGAGGSLES